jgi:hypothetical protein
MRLPDCEGGKAKEEVLADFPQVVAVIEFQTSHASIFIVEVSD